MAPKLIIVIAAVLLVHAGAAAQTRDTTAAAGAHTQHRERSRAGITGFRDVNGNGIDDRIERPGTSGASRKDRFIDADGDGICDGRAGGLGFKRGTTGVQQGAGKGNGAGNRNGQGGKK